MSHRLNASILNQRREDLLFRATGLCRRRTIRDRELARAAAYQKDLDRYATTDYERTIVRRVRTRFRAFRAATAGPGESIESVGAITDGLPAVMEQFREQTRVQMAASIRASEKLNSDP